LIEAGYRNNLAIFGRIVALVALFGRILWKSAFTVAAAI
jgi:hypothetical protein